LLYSQKDTSIIIRQVDLNEVEVSARRSQTTYQQAGRVVNVITRQELESISVQSLQDLLDYVSGVDLRQRGPMGIQADVSLRGGTFDQVMVLLNGINITDPQTGHLSLNLPVDLESIERVEILEGPGARVFGPSAFSGAINFITGQHHDNRIRAGLSTGENGYLKGVAGTTVNWNKSRHFVSGSWSKSDGYHENTDFKQASVFYHGILNMGEQTVELQTGYADKSFGAFAFYTPVFANQFEQNRTLFTSLKMTSNGPVRLTPSIYWRRNHDRFELFRDNPATWYAGHNYHMTDVMGANLNSSINWSGGTTSLGGEVRSESIWSNNIGEPMEYTIPVPGEDGQVFTRFYSRTNVSLFLEHAYTRGAFSLSAGLLYNWNNGIGPEGQMFPGVDVSFRLNDKIKLYASANQSLRMPTFTDMYYKTSTAVGDRNLKPEEVTGYELGVKWQAAQLSAQLNGFYRDASHLIDWGRYDVSEVFRARNISQMESVGYQASAIYRPNADGFLNGFVRFASVDYLFLHQTRKVEENYDSRYVMDYLKHKLVTRLSHRVMKNLSASWACSYNNRGGWFADAQNQQQAYSPFWLTDLKISWKKNGFEVYSEVSNLFDVDFEDIGNVPQPGRWVRGGIKMDLKL
jgi:iron complex outermembrane receptor protein